jgi:lysophospholipase L1-like esterase
MRLHRVLAASAASLAVALAAGELAVRKLDLIDRLNGFPRTLFVKSTDPDLSYTMAPNLDVQVRRFAVQTNSLGMREREVEPEATPGVVRILVLGDSVAFGEGLPAEEALPARLGAQLAASTARSIEVLNGGVEGYNSTQELALLRKLEPVLEPDVVIVVFSLNDWDTAPRIDSRGVLTREPDPGRAPGLLDRSELVPVLRAARAQALFEWRRLTAGNASPGSAGTGGFTPLDVYLSRLRKQFWANPSGEGLAGLERAFSGFAGDARQHDFRLLVAIVPDGDQIGRTEPDLRPQEQVRALCERYKIACIDLYPDFRDSAQPALYFDIMHPNETGHEIMAHALAEYLVQSGMLGTMPALDMRAGFIG